MHDVRPSSVDLVKISGNGALLRRCDVRFPLVESAHPHHAVHWGLARRKHLIKERTGVSFKLFGLSCEDSVAQWSLRRFGGDFSGGKVCALINKA